MVLACLQLLLRIGHCGSSIVDSIEVKLLHPRMFKRSSGGGSLEDQNSQSIEEGVITFSGESRFSEGLARWETKCRIRASW